ncbi:MAG: 50S ribosomal protein L40e [Candidatus Diapherotrites archaeon]|uniref:50S ribosomal protein L40e n=1 Tax=Candidatus Iainarchaeum sp. TaxID=3101447 RepID=A0A7J4IUQ8_9ARCH|nr:MAG: hypothetical protein QT03_C0001G0196 [archaeon GW2011_AR10]MBS3059463.1 50S ribosomal protein L40e [Candidatus Diapherotrites archaeon]HIH08524.1 50S ribosomal protein L40e [Candidatus Diapherotrites archaeon]
MARFEAADNRIFSNVWVCLKCKKKIRSSPGKRPDACRKCGYKKFRLKNKAKKS